MKFKPLPFQSDGVEFLLSNSRCLLADQTGLGKSPQAIFAAHKLGGNVLIVCPASLTLMWGQAIDKFLSGEEYTVLQLRQIKEKVPLSGRLRFIVVSFQFLHKKKQLARLLKVKWSCIIADEAHKIKNFKSLTCRAFCKLADATTGKIWMMTATPATSSGQDYYSYLHIAQPGKWGTYSGFSEYFCDVEVDWWSGGKRYKGVRQDRRKILRAAFAKITLRRIKTAVLAELPPIVVKNLRVHLSAAGERISPVEIRFAIDKNGAVVPKHIAKLLNDVGVAKIDAAVEYCLGVEEPLVVFCTHTEVLRQIKVALETSGRRCASVTGQDSREEKNRAEVDFQRGVLDVILCNIQAGGEGITLTRASHMLMVEQCWSPAVVEQAYGRVDRIGQKATCIHITNMIGYDTIDEDILEVLKEKSTFMKDVMGDDLWQ